MEIGMGMGMERVEERERCKKRDERHLLGVYPPSHARSMGQIVPERYSLQAPASCVPQRLPPGPGQP